MNAAGDGVAVTERRSSKSNKRLSTSSREGASFSALMAETMGSCSDPNPLRIHKTSSSPSTAMQMVASSKANDSAYSTYSETGFDPFRLKLGFDVLKARP